MLAQLVASGQLRKHKSPTLYFLVLGNVATAHIIVYISHFAPRSWRMRDACSDAVLMPPSVIFTVLHDLTWLWF